MNNSVKSTAIPSLIGEPTTTAILIELATVIATDIAHQLISQAFGKNTKTPDINMTDIYILHLKCSIAKFVVLQFGLTGLSEIVDFNVSDELTQFSIWQKGTKITFHYSQHSDQWIRQLTTADA